VQRGLLLPGHAGRIDEIRVRVEQTVELVGPPVGRRLLDGPDGALYLVVPLVALLVHAHEQLELGVAQGLGDLVDGPARRVGRAGVEAAIERAPDRVDVARARGGEDALAILLVDRGLEPPPAGEAVLARDRQLGRGKPGAGILRQHRLQTLLGLVAEVLEVGAERKRLSHDEPSFLSQGKALALRPASASFGQEVRLCVRLFRTEWAEPFTRTVGPSIGPRK